MLSPRIKSTIFVLFWIFVIVLFSFIAIQATDIYVKIIAILLITFGGFAVYNRFTKKAGGMVHLIRFLIFLLLTIMAFSMQSYLLGTVSAVALLYVSYKALKEAEDG